MPLDNDSRQLIRKYALKNAMEYGKAREETVFNKVLSKDQKLKSRMDDLRKEIKTIVAEVNQLGRDEISNEAARYAGEFEKEYKQKIEKTGKPSFLLDGVEVGNFKTRFPPEPNGYMHIGHSKAAFIERELAGLYKGKLALYFDDTNPETEKQEFVELFKKDLKWLGITFDEEYYASDSIPKVYQYAERLIALERAYVCDCSPERLKESRETGIACRHKGNRREENLKEWKIMLAGDAPENTALLFNGDLKADNTVMRDAVLFRIKKMPHYRQGSRYTVWPTYNFSTPIIDSINGITDTIRSKEYELRDELYNTILDLLELRKPRIHSIARLEIKGNITSKRKLNELLKQGLINGFDDPRLVTIAGLRKRGIVPEAIKEFVLRSGLSKANSLTDIGLLLSYNRKIVDKRAKRLFYLEEPVKMTVNNIPEENKCVKLNLHPTEGMGYREYALNDNFAVSKKDASALKEGMIIRLKELFNIKIRKIDKALITAEYQEGASADVKLLWLSEGNFISCKLVHISNLFNGESFNRESIKTSNGYIENYAGKVMENEVVQLETTGFFKLDDKKSMSFLSL